MKLPHCVGSYHHRRLLSLKVGKMPGLCLLVLLRRLIHICTSTLPGQENRCALCVVAMMLQGAGLFLAQRLLVAWPAFQSPLNPFCCLRKCMSLKGRLATLQFCLSCTAFGAGQERRPCRGEWSSHEGFLPGEKDAE